MGDEMKKKVIAVVAIVLILAIAVVIGINFNKKQSKNNKQSNSGQATSTYNGKLPGLIYIMEVRRLEVLTATQWIWKKNICVMLLSLLIQTERFRLQYQLMAIRFQRFLTK